MQGNSTQHLILYTDAILEFWVDDTHYFGGDFYTYRKAPPVLHLSPGTHRIDIRLVRDVRAFGGILAPTIDVLLHAEQALGTVELAKPGILISDVVDGQLASPWASVFLRNSGEDDVEIMDIRNSNVGPPILLQELDSQMVLAQDSRVLTDKQASASSSNNASSTILAAGQTRPIAFNASLPSHNVSSLQYVVTYRRLNGGRTQTLEVTQDLLKTSIYQPHKITFQHPGGMVSYAMLRPPAKNASCKANHNSSLPVLLNLHGAGLEADNGIVAHALDPVSDLCAFVLFPTGVTPWSGDDWREFS